MRSFSGFNFISRLSPAVACYLLPSALLCVFIHITRFIHQTISSWLCVQVLMSRGVSFVSFVASSTDEPKTLVIHPPMDKAELISLLEAAFQRTPAGFETSSGVVVPISVFLSKPSVFDAKTLKVRGQSGFKAIDDIASFHFHSLMRFVSRCISQCLHKTRRKHPQKRSLRPLLPPSPRRLRHLPPPQQPIPIRAAQFSCWL